jgi:hypothetical protein
MRNTIRAWAWVPLVIFIACLLSIYLPSVDVQAQQTVCSITPGACPTGGGSLYGSWVSNVGGLSRVTTTDITNATTNFANITGISSTVAASRKYAGRLTLRASDSTAADGIKLDFNGGTATMTSFWAACYQMVGGAVTPGTVISTSLAGVINWTTITGDTYIACEISFVPSATGTFIPRQAQNAHTTGTLTVNVGSYLNLDDIP